MVTSAAFLGGRLRLHHPFLHRPCTAASSVHCSLRPGPVASHRLPKPLGLPPLPRPFFLLTGNLFSSILSRRMLLSTFMISALTLAQ